MNKITNVCLGVLALAACTPTVKVEAPDKPIEINMNVNIEHRVKVEIERDVQQAIKNNKDIF
ncbi:MAG: YnbE family lipoprotein [Micavibrio aeruginosavorus]|uniref:YnbE family lipoprotein n=1 Tax=Micavibrio aeruginosavorus TaxID=349221 RepID=A0A2W5C494_9BACT|nr:MAG: YnbE family lipoprotein [Micavibrio aeruginosavorus]